MSARAVLVLAGVATLAVGLMLMFITPGGAPSLSARVRDAFGYGGSHSDATNYGRSLFHSDVDIGGIKAGQTYAQFNSRRAKDAVDGFSGFGCLESCADHEVGFSWAAEQGISNASKCIGRSWSEVEGCAAFVSLRNNTR